MVAWLHKRDIALLMGNWRKVTRNIYRQWDFTKAFHIESQVSSSIHHEEKKDDTYRSSMYINKTWRNDLYRCIIAAVSEVSRKSSILCHKNSFFLNKLCLLHLDEIWGRGNSMRTICNDIRVLSIAKSCGIIKFLIFDIKNKS